MRKMIFFGEAAKESEEKIIKSGTKRTTRDLVNGDLEVKNFFIFLILLNPSTLRQTSEPPPFAKEAFDEQASFVKGGGQLLEQLAGGFNFPKLLTSLTQFSANHPLL